MGRVAALVLMLVLTACSPIAILNATAPRAGIVTTRGIPYEAGPRHMLDVYAPKVRRADTPVVLFFYGGGWDSGDRREYRFVGATLAARGMVVVIPDYRLYPQVRFPAYMQDAAAAAAWTHAQIAAYGGDPARIFVMGHSAGAQIATLLALDGRYLQAAGLTAHDFAGVIGLAGPYDFLPLHDAELEQIFPGPDRSQSQPINFVTPQAPPMFLAAGTDDKLVDPANTRRLAARLRQDGVPVEEKIYPGVDHRIMIGAFAPLLTILAPVRRDTLRFIAAHNVSTAQP